MDEPTLPAKVVSPGTAEVLALGPTQIHVLVRGADTGDRLTLVEEHLPPGSGSPPPHVHRAMDHVFYVTSGTVRFTAAGEDVEVGPGGAVFVPRGVDHTFQNASDAEPASFLEFDGPGRFDDYFHELASLLRDEGFVVDRIRELQARYDTWPPASR